METKDIIKQVNSIFVDVLDDEKISISESSTADDIDDWDSLTNIQLVVAIERHFKIKFTSIEVKAFKNVGEMCVAIQTKVSQL
mgnify:CR=1 FL=1